MSATTVEKLTDAELDALIHEHADVWAKYQSAQAEKSRRDTEAEEKAEKEKKEKLHSSAAFKKLVDRYKKAKTAIKAACGTKEATLTLPLTFTVESDCIENYVPDFDDAFDDGNIDASIANNSPGINKKQKVVLEEGLNQVMQSVGDEVRDLFSDWSDEQKAALAELQKAVDRVKASCAKKEFSTSLPITFSFETEERCYEDDEMCEKDFSEVFERGSVSANIGNATGVSKKQKAMLQQGLDNVIEDACETIYAVFFDVTKEQESALADLNKVLEDAEKMGVEDWEDLA